IGKLWDSHHWRCTTKHLNCQGLFMRSRHCDTLILVRAYLALSQLIIFSSGALRKAT
ncbi:uncharacterized protein METZ01_LOCUS332740, partial [marine metagenome]